MKIKQIEWKDGEWNGKQFCSADLPFGYHCVVRHDSQEGEQVWWRYSFKQRALPVESGVVGMLGEGIARCEEIWESLLMEAMEEGGCEYCLAPVTPLIYGAWEDKGLKSFLETGIDSNSLYTSADIRSEYREGEKKISYCPMCGRRLEEE